MTADAIRLITAQRDTAVALLNQRTEERDQANKALHRAAAECDRLLDQDARLRADLGALLAELNNLPHFAIEDRINDALSRSLLAIPADGGMLWHF